jgi:hypothetical protein
MIIVVPSCLKDADGARTRSDQLLQSITRVWARQERSGKWTADWPLWLRKLWVATAGHVDVLLATLNRMVISDKGVAYNLAHINRGHCCRSIFAPVSALFLAATSSSRSDVVTPSMRLSPYFYYSQKWTYGALKSYTALSNKTNNTNNTNTANKTNKTNKTKEFTYPSQLPDPTRACLWQPNLTLSGVRE